MKLLSMFKNGYKAFFGDLGKGWTQVVFVNSLGEVILKILLDPLNGRVGMLDFENGILRCYRSVKGGELVPCSCHELSMEVQRRGQKTPARAGT